MRFRNIMFTAFAGIVPLLAYAPLLAQPVRDGTVHGGQLAFRPLTIVQQGSEFIIAERAGQRAAPKDGISIGSTVTFDRDLVHSASPLTLGDQHASDQ